MMRPRTRRPVLLLLLAGCASSGQERGSALTLTRQRLSVAESSGTQAARNPEAAQEPAPQDPAGAAAIGERVEQPIDLTGALRLAGASSLDIEFARERLAEAQARRAEADVLWFPDIFLGATYDKHEGNVQTTPGFIIDASQNAGFVGGGLVASFGLADAIFEPGVASHEVRAEQAALTRSINDALLEVALAYNDLLEAQYELAIARESVSETEELASLAGSFARTGQGLESDAARVQSHLSRQRRAEVAAEQRLATRSARLATLLRFDPTVRLRAADSGVVPVTLISEDTQLGELIERALATRPEIDQLTSIVDAAGKREDQERLRPLIPNLLVGLGGGGLGGGTGSNFDNFGGTGDLSVGVVWGLDNLGLGNRATTRRRKAQSKQAQVALARVRDRIAGEVAIAYQEVHDGRRQIEFAAENVEHAQRSLELNMARIRAAEGLPIEALQAVQAAADAREAFLEATLDYNRAQLRLLRAVGRPPR